MQVQRRKIANPQCRFRARASGRTDRAMTVEFKSSCGGTPMEDLIKLTRELFEPTEPQKDTNETPKPILLESILPRLPPEGQAWLNGLNHYCRRAVEHDLRAYGPDLFVKYWGTLRDTLQKLERDLGPSDNWK